MFHPSFDGIRTVLAIGAHPDDIEIGCGATLLRLLAEQSVHVHWVVLSGDETRQKEATSSAAFFLENAVSTKVVTKEFRDAYFPAEYSSIKDHFASLKADVEPDLVLTHRLEDAHQDHRLVAELTWNAFRNHLIFEYEIPKYEGDLGQPNVYVTINEDVAQRKVGGILDVYASQADQHWFSEDTFRAMLRMRGLEAKSPTCYAEAFTVRKLVV